MNTKAIQSQSEVRRALLRRAAVFAAWFERHAMGNRLMMVLMVLALGMGALTYATMARKSLLASDTNTLILLLNVDLVVLLLLVAGIARRVVGLWAQSKKGMAGSALQVRLVGLFSLLVAFPAIVTTVFSVGLFYYGVHGWFDSRVRTAVDESLAVAKAYLDEHQQVLKADIRGMAADLERESLLLASNPKALEKMLNTQSFLRNFSEVIIFDGENHVIAQSGIALSMIFSPIPDDLIDRARAGDVAVETSDNDDRLRAMVRLAGFGDETFLYVGRSVDQKVLSHLDTTRAAVAQYQELAAKSQRIQVTITMLYVVVVLLLMTIAIWFGLTLARRMVEPIGAVINASERLRAGDMGARVGETEGLEEFVNLGRAFNRMTEEIAQQRNELIKANKRLDDRRRFTETVLGGVSTGIIGVNVEGFVTLANPAAGRLLGIDSEKLLGQKLQEFLPDITVTKRGEQEISVLRRDGARRRFIVRVTTEGESVVAFDDVTDLMAAQKSAAWADVARRIAHEIKNPLTPIQLSAERIKRKYLGQMADDKDREILAKCTDTIVHHVEDIKTMVNAFAGFAKMPEPVMANANLESLVREVVALQSAATSVEILVQCQQGADWNVVADQQLVRQALTNLIKNAIEALAETPAPKVAVVLGREEKGVWLSVLDNGPGIPASQRESVLEPYVTTKLKGTGLGLAIVKKIVEDHGGRLTMDDPAPMMANYTGAHIHLFFPDKRGS
ncbi:MAG: PAS domain-containing sensor histidine kinase [Alphaproteobacteria bacterium]|nr:PAS domain-containing sensor histidine kinase [Alphaproteobacteria bacterium]